MKYDRVMKCNMISGVLVFILSAGRAMGAEFLQLGAPKGDEGTRIFKATENAFYSGQSHLTGQQTILVGSMRDQSPFQITRKAFLVLTFLFISDTFPSSFQDINYCPFSFEGDF